MLGITGEWRHRTITSSLLAAPDRLRFLAAKTLAFAAAGVVLSLLIVVAVAIAGFAILTIRDLPTPDLGEWIVQVLRNAMVAALWGGLGVAPRRARAQPGRGRGGRARAHLRGRLRGHRARARAWAATAPSAPCPTAVAGLPAGGRRHPRDVDLLPGGLAALAMLAWIGALFAIGAILLIRRDVE